MRHSDILAKFLSMFPNYVDKVVRWSPDGHNVIKIRLDDYSGLLFTYTTPKIWTLESIAGFTNRKD
jgi:hypothetical protein